MQWPLTWITAASWRLTTSSVWPASRSRQRFADADDRRDAAGQRGLGLVGHQRVGFAVVLAPLRMADDGIAHAEFLQHGGRHLAGVGALRRAPTHPARPARCGEPATQRLHLRQVRRGHADGDIAGRLLGSPASNALAPAPRWRPGCRSSSSCRRSVSSCHCRLAYQVSTILPMCWFDSISACALRARRPAANVLWIDRLDRRRFEQRPDLFAQALRDRAP